ATIRRCAQEVGDIELRLTEELVSAAGLEADEGAQGHSDGLRRQASDPLELVSPGIGIEEREKREQIGEVEEGEALLIRVVEDELQALLLGRVGAEHLRQQERAEVGHGRTDGNSRPDAPE